MDLAVAQGDVVVDVTGVVGPLKSLQERFFQDMQEIGLRWLQAKHPTKTFNEEALRSEMVVQSKYFKMVAKAAPAPAVVAATPTRQIQYGVVRTPPPAVAVPVVAAPLVPIAVAAPLPVAAPPALAPLAPRQVCGRCGLNHDTATCRTALERLVCMRCGNLGHAMAICPN